MPVSSKPLPPGKKFIYGCIIFSLVVLAYLASAHQLNLWELDTLTFRQRILQEKRADKSPITLLSVDEKTFSDPDMNALFGKYPWRRDAYALTVRFLKRANPRKVLFDISFDGGKDEQRENDRVFVESLAGSDRFAASLLPLFNPGEGFTWNELPENTRAMLQRNALTINGIENAPEIQHCRSVAITQPLPELMPALSFYSPACIVSDPSGVVRYWIPVMLFDKIALPHSSLGLVMKNNRTPLTISGNGVMNVGEQHVRIGNGAPLIRWYGSQKIDNTAREDNRPYPEFSLVDVIRSELALSCKENPVESYCSKIKPPEKPILSPDVFRDRYVIIGVTSVNAFDSHNTIYGGRHYPGVYLIANITDNALHNDFALPAPLWLNLLLGLAGCAAVLWMVFRLEQISTALMGSTVLITAYFLLCVWAYLGANMWLNAVLPMTGMGVCFFGAYIYRYLKARKAREQLRFAFGKYVSPSVMQVIEKNPEAIKLGGTRQEMTMLFCDIRGFTTYSENHSPEEVQTMLSQYFTIMNNIILNKYQGTINKLIGDAIFAYWGFPLKTDEHALLAVSAAMSMRAAIDEWQKDPDKPFVDIGIGIHTGEVMVGNVGSEDFMDFTLIGDAVNTAARLESLNKEMKTRIIISENTYRHIDSIVKARPLGSTKVKGKENEVGIFEPTSLSIRI